MVKADGPTLLHLPAELQRLIIEELSLSDQLIYQTQVCVALRSLFDGRLILSQPHRFDLVQWTRAEGEVRERLDRERGRGGQEVVGLDRSVETLGKKSIWDTSPSSTPRPAPSRPPASLVSPSFCPQSLQDLNQQQKQDAFDLGPLEYANHPDVALFVRCMRLLGKIDNRNHSSNLPLCRLWSNDLIALSLLSRSGFKVASLIHLLETQPSLQGIETILMTSASFIDAGVKSVSNGQSMHSDMQHPASTCIDTQAIVIAGPGSLRGRGLRSGFKCLCFTNTDSNTGRTGDDDPDSNPPTPFHVIFHDWYDEEEARGTEDMLENSKINCNACKRIICF